MSNIFKTLAVSVSDSIMTIVMKRPKVNAMNSELLTDLARVFQQASTASEVKGVLLRSDFGSTFSGGVDLSSGHDMCKAKDRSAIDKFFFETLPSGVLSPISCSKPVAAAVNGHAIAGGTIIAVACDYVALGNKKQFYFGLTEIAVGIPFPFKIIKALRKQLPPSSVRKLIFDANLITSTDAFKMGLGNEMGENPDQLALNWLRLQSKRPLVGYQVCKNKWWKDVQSLVATEEEKREYFDAITSQECLDAMKNTLKKP
ncbi:unnamed protein product [Didymodactylos carnosus]|uniref:Enoyl-CoA hydratase n=1 Tax=Didymodactylos carnosus TaxID=1234261 RepID=A0A814S171_9BILA|nr:unnamed protein product [Didymodactylos carnosus]CAF1141768.1 unnamed protein product [Didymodactylos carnosus]CAF3805013.1 unnamed protein product [Didymodactylos carnosus]CAF3905446.1 unnamed protein product [Didymodactylos carnosus]